MNRVFVVSAVAACVWVSSCAETADDAEASAADYPATVSLHVDGALPAGVQFGIFWGQSSPYEVTPLAVDGTAGDIDAVLAAAPSAAAFDEHGIATGSLVVVEGALPATMTGSEPLAAMGSGYVFAYDGALAEDQTFDGFVLPAGAHGVDYLVDGDEIGAWNDCAAAHPDEDAVAACGAQPPLYQLADDGDRMTVVVF